MVRALGIPLALCLLFAALAGPSGSPLAQPYVPEEVDAETAVPAVKDLAERMTNSARTVKSHRFAPVY